ncbi:velvet factor, partial [Truncatella angustata]
YALTIRQQPMAARSCGFGERDRRVIDPPPIVEVKVDDPLATPGDVREALRIPFMVMHCTIWDDTGKQDISFMPEEYRQQRRLMGTAVASPFTGRDETGVEGCFFCFPDLSVRTSGTFKLKFILVMADPLINFIGARHRIRASAISEVFTVYSAKDFPGMQASTPLTKKLKEQGCLISIKKGNERGGRGRNDSDDDDSDDDNGDTGASTAGRRKKQRK